MDVADRLINDEEKDKLSAELNSDSNSEFVDDHGNEFHELAEEHKDVDYSHFTKKDFVILVKELSHESDFKKIEQVLKEIRPLFDEIRDRERTEAFVKFKSEGGVDGDFEYRLDELDTQFDAHYKLLRDKRNQFFKSQEELKADNLRKKSELLEKFRLLVDGEDSEHSFRTFKEIQREWKQIGAIPNNQAKTIWANYNALIDRFYDQRSIYFELKELDRKKNLELKNELCVKAEKLNSLPSLNSAIRELNELHHEFKHIGPVPKEDQETVWQRFKGASDAIYHKRDEYLTNLQVELTANLEKKMQVSEEVAPFAAFTSDKIKEWNQQTQLILAVQKKWDAIGAVPRTKTKEVNKKFWSAFKLFFHNKNQYFRKLDEERAKNLQLKMDLIQAATELKASTDWERTAKELKNIQSRWKEIGPVPEKQREKVYQEFKVACDYFFEQRRISHEQADKEHEENLRKKEEVIALMEKHVSEGTASVELFQSLQASFQSIGFVPKHTITSIKEKFNDVSTRFLNSISGISTSDKEQLNLVSQVAGLKNDPDADRKIYHKEQVIRKQIQKAENDIAVLRNNLEFFGRSKNADKFKEEFNEKIRIADEHLGQLKKQLKILMSAS